MNNYILYPIVELKGFIIFSIVALVMLTFLTLFFMGKKKKGMKDFGWQALFLGRSRRELFLVCLGISQVCLVFSIIFFGESLGTVQITALLVLCILRGILGLSVTGFFGELVYGGLMGAALGIETLLLDYMRETGAELYIGLIWGLLTLFILQYSIYYFVRNLERMLLKHEKQKY